MAGHASAGTDGQVGPLPFVPAELLEAAPDAIVGVDRSGRIRLANGQAVAMFGYTREELLSMQVEQLVPARFLPKHERHRASYIDNPKARPMGAGLALFGRRKDGTEFPVDVSLTAIETGGGKLAAAFVRDVTERKRAEANLRQANEDLESFSHTISHDLRAPLRTMRGFSQALIEDAPAGLDATSTDYLRRIDRAAASLERLVDDLLEYSGLGRREVQTRAVDPAAVVREVLRGLATLVESSKAEIRLEGSFPTVEGEPELLGQAIANFITNAIKYVAPGRAAQIRIYSGKSGEWVRITVEDHGIGIAPEYQARIWKPFERLHNKTEYLGTGVGLAIVERAAERMGGRVGVESTLGEGSKFWIELRRAGGV